VRCGCVSGWVGEGVGEVREGFGGVRSGRFVFLEDSGVLWGHGLMFSPLVMEGGRLIWGFNERRGFERAKVSMAFWLAGLGKTKRFGCGPCGCKARNDRWRLQMHT